MGSIAEEKKVGERIRKRAPSTHRLLPSRTSIPRGDHCCLYRSPSQAGAWPFSHAMEGKKASEEIRGRERKRKDGKWFFSTSTSLLSFVFFFLFF